MKLTYEQVLDLLPAYAVGALEAEEETAVNEYLRLQKELIQNLSRAESATTLLAQGTGQASMAPDAQTRMMERIRADVPHSSLPLPPENDAAKVEDSAAAAPPMEVAPLSTTPATGAQVNGASKEPGGRRETRLRQPPARRGRRPARVPARSSSGQPVRVHASQIARQRGQRRPPPNLFPAPPPKRSFLGGIFSTRALINATMVASLVTLLFMSLLNLQGEQQLREYATDLRANNSRLAQNESRIDTLNEANAALSTSNTSLIQQNSNFITAQASLTQENTELAIENERIQGARSELLAEFTNAEEENKQIAIERATMAEEIARLQNQVDANNERVSLIGSATQAILLFGTDEAPNLQGTFFQNERNGALVLYGLEPLAEDETYQAWLVTSQGDQISVGLFAAVEERDATWADVLLPQNLPSYEAIGISIEPTGGSDEPTSPMLLESIPLSTELPDTVG